MADQINKELLERIFSPLVEKYRFTDVYEAYEYGRDMYSSIERTKDFTKELPEKDQKRALEGAWQVLREKYGEDAYECAKAYERYMNAKESEEFIVLEKFKEDVQKIEKNIFNMLSFAEFIRKQRPYFYDMSKQFWLWDGNKYIPVDEVHLLKVVMETNVFANVPESKVKQQLLDALRIVGRKYIPKEPPPHLLQFGNWIYNLETGERRIVTPDFFFTNPIPWEPGSSEDTPMIDKLFEEWVGAENKQTLYELIAYCMYRAYPIHRFFVLYGVGSNGKTQFIKLLKKFLGYSNISTINFTKFIKDPRFETYNFYRKLVVTATEIPDVVLDNTAFLKAVTGGDLIEAEKKFKMPFSFTNYAKLIISANALPITKDRSTGFYRRTFIIEFPNFFPDGTDIVDTIPEQEFKNLARKCIRILRELLQRGRFSNEEELEQKMKRYEQLSNPLLLFIDEACENDVNGEIELWEFYDKFTNWAIEHGYRAKLYSKKRISQILREMGYDTATKLVSVNVDGMVKESRRVIVYGLRWKQKDKGKETGGFTRLSIGEFGRCSYCGEEAILFYKDSKGNRLCERCYKEEVAK